MYESHLRDLARQLMAVARAHFAYSQAAHAMDHLNSHLNALARIEEFNRRDHEQEESSGGGGQRLSEDVPDGGRVP
jgi:hypothetical protein